MARYTSNKKLSEMEPTKKSSKKIWAMLLSGVAAVSIASGFAYSSLKDNLQHNSDVQNTPIEFEMNTSASSTPVLSKYLKDNKQTIDKLRRDLIAYQEYHNMPNRSEATEKKMEALINKLSSPETLYTVSQFSLNLVKAKMADAYKLKDYHDIQVRVSNDPTVPREYSIINTETNELLFKPDIGFFSKSDAEKMKLHETIEKTIALQNVEADKDSKSNKTRLANQAYLLYNSAIKTANTKYIAKNGKLMEVGEPKVVTPTLTQKVKDTDDERGL